MLPQDPYILLSYVNMKLRDSYNDLDEFCAVENIDKSELIATLSGVGAEYIPELDQFR